VTSKEQIQQRLLSFLQQYWSADYKRIVIAYSAGLDSHVLLHAMVDLFQQQAFAKFCAEQGFAIPHLHALHIDHGIQVESANWAKHCESIAKALGVSFSSSKVVVQAKANIEKHARDARYEAFSAFSQAGDLLLLAHHRQDQVETFLYRMMRGSGVLGLSGMQPLVHLSSGLTYARPLLNTELSLLQVYADEQNLDYIDDPSNESLNFDRNFIRSRLIPLIEYRWPNMQERLNKNLSLLSDAQSLLEDLAAIDYQQVAFDYRGHVIPLSYFASLDKGGMRLSNLIRYIFRAKLATTSPTGKQLEYVVKMVLDNDQALEQVVGEYVLRSYNGCLYICQKSEGEVQQLKWLDEERFILASVQYQLQGINKDRVEIRQRQGGEKLMYKGCNRKLKSLLQEQYVEPWLRESQPLVYIAENLCLVGAYIQSDQARKLGVKLSIEC